MTALARAPDATHNDLEAVCSGSAQRRNAPSARPRSWVGESRSARGCDATGWDETGVAGKKYEQVTERLVNLIYDAAVRPSGWTQLTAALSDAFDAAAHIVINLPGSIPRQHFHTGLTEGYPETFAENIIKGLPYSSSSFGEFIGQFTNMANTYPEVKLAETDFFKEWMAPQGFAPIWPIGLSFTLHDNLPVGGVSFFRRASGSEFSDAERKLGESLIPHFGRAINFYSTLDGVQRERLALAEVIDRLPTGVILIDAECKPVIRNRSAERLIELNDGFKVDKRGPYAVDTRENATLQKLLADALECEPGQELRATGFMAVSRPSANRSFPLMVTPLLAATPGSAAREAVVALFISNPEADQVSASESLETLYDLTTSEAELVRLLLYGGNRLQILSGEQVLYVAHSLHFDADAAIVPAQIYNPTPWKITRRG